MKRLLSLAVLLPLGAPCGAGLPLAGERPPNVVLIVADDLGYGDLGSYGQSRILTPRLDRMAGEGMRFTQFYAGSPVCAPSRASLMTGLHTGHSPIRGNRQHAQGQQPLPASFVTLAEVLREAGYATGATGKWGLGGPGTEGAPTRQGFDAFFGYLSQSLAHFYYPESLYRGEERVLLRGNHDGRRTEYSHDVIAEEALRFIERHAAAPFFLYVPFTIPHAELAAPEDAYAPYVDAHGASVFPETPFPGPHYGPQPRPRATYAAMVSRMDRDVGRILDRLGDLGLARDTIVLFTSDNGPSIEGGSDPTFFRSSGPLRGGKRDVYEGGVRVPLIVWGPGRIPAAAVSDHVWASWDVLPTLARMTGAPAPPGIDGLDMHAALTGSGAPDHEFLYWEFHEQGGKQALRKGRWKAVRRDAFAQRDAPPEVYDLTTDPGETRDLSAARPEVARELASLMRRAHTPSPHFPGLDAPLPATER